jgi:hypothetical protein
VYRIYAHRNPFLPEESAYQFAASIYGSSIAANLAEARKYAADMRDKAGDLAQEQRELARLKDVRARIFGDSGQARRRRRELTRQIQQQEAVRNEEAEGLRALELRFEIILDRNSSLELRKEALAWLLSSDYPVQVAYTGTDEPVLAFMRRVQRERLGRKLFRGARAMGPLDAQREAQRSVAQAFQDLVRRERLSDQANPLFAAYLDAVTRVEEERAAKIAERQKPRRRTRRQLGVLPPMAPIGARPPAYVLPIVPQEGPEGRRLKAVYEFARKDSKSGAPRSLRAQQEFLSLWFESQYEKMFDEGEYSLLWEDSQGRLHIDAQADAEMFFRSLKDAEKRLSSSVRGLARTAEGERLQFAQAIGPMDLDPGARLEGRVEAPALSYRPEDVFVLLTEMMEMGQPRRAAIIAAHLGFREERGQWVLEGATKKAKEERSRRAIASWEAEAYHRPPYLAGCPTCAKLAARTGAQPQQVASVFNTWLASERARRAAENPARAKYSRRLPAHGARIGALRKAGVATYSGWFSVPSVESRYGGRVSVYTTPEYQSYVVGRLNGTDRIVVEKLYGDP